MDNLAHLLNSSSLTRDEIVGNLLGWIEGPCNWVPVSDDFEPDEPIEEIYYNIREALEEKDCDLAEAYIAAKDRGDSPETLADLTRQRAAFREQVALIPRILLFLDHEINQGAQSMLVLDRLADSYPSRYTIISVAAWAKAKFGIAYTPSLNGPLDLKIPEAAFEKLPAPESPPSQPDPTDVRPPEAAFKEEPAPESPPSQTKATQDTPLVQRKMLDQEEAIIDCIKGMGYDPKKLPPAPPGQPGAKAAAREKLSKDRLFTAKTAFDKAWERLRSDGNLVSSPPHK